MDEEKQNLLIRYPRRRGFILEAHKLQQQIRAKFNLSVELEEHDAEDLSLLLGDTPIYSKYFADSTGIPHAEILQAVGECAQPLTEIGEALAETRHGSGDDDPDHHQWLNSVCSGE